MRARFPAAVAVLMALVSAAPSAAHAWGGKLPAGPEGWRHAGLEGIRGATIGPIESSQQPGRGYGTPYSAALLDELARLGVNWVSLTPFGRIWSLKSTQIELTFEAPYDANRDAIRRMVAQAHERGIKVLLIPHLWVETGGWRGEIDPGSDAGWAEYQRSYRDFVLTWARNAEAAGADALSVGVECKSWSGRYESVWEALIRDIRGAFHGLLTYSANWDEVDQVVFWEHLDLVGINAFYPLADHNGATDSEYWEGAARRRDEVRAYAEALDMPVLFVEVGYTTRANAAVEPWLWPDGMKNVVIDEHEQARALDATFHAFLGEPWFVGFFVWRYYANIDDVSQEAEWGFSPHAKEAEDVLRRTFRARWAVDPDPLRMP
ncbi:MAG: hypothetical protein KC417_11915 [Myxococcales bacterium]|nr:hypothetical protein [Myxococcales bacterium]